jgi:hypothetical protein
VNVGGRIVRHAADVRHGNPAGLDVDLHGYHHCGPKSCGQGSVPGRAIRHPDNEPGARRATMAHVPLRITSNANLNTILKAHPNLQSDQPPGENYVGHQRMYQICRRLRCARIDWTNRVWRENPLALDFVRSCFIFDEEFRKMKNEISMRIIQNHK